MPDFHRTADLAATRLGPETPLGLFVPLGGSSVKSFWIVDHAGRRSAIILDADDPRHRFEAFVLTDDTANWTGMAMGPVEVLVAADGAEYADVPQFHRGCITITAGKVHVAAVPSGQLGTRVSFEVGQSAQVEGNASVRFARWQLVQRNHDGSAEVLFEQAATPSLA